MSEGKELDYKFEIKDGIVKLVVSYEGKGLKSELVNELSAEYFGAKLKEAIPGGVDDVVIDMLVALLKK